MKKNIHIGIAEDHDLVRQGLITMLKEYEGIDVLFDVGNGRDLVEALKKSKPDIVLLDIEMPLMNGKEALEKIKPRHPKLKVIVISAYYHEAFILEYIKMGVNCFLPKNTKIDKLVEAIQTVYEQGAYFDNKVSMIMAREFASPTEAADEETEPLTDREITVLKHICSNKSNREIADVLGLSQRTVEWHRNNIMHKTKTKNAAALTAYAIRHHHITII